MGNIYLEQLIKMAAEESEAYQKMKANRAKAGKDMEMARNQRVSDAPRLKEPLTPAQKKILAIQEEKANATKAQEAKAANDAKISKMKAESNARSTAPVKPDPSTRPFTMVEPEKAKPGANARERMAAKVEERNAGSNKARLDNALKNSGAGEVKVTMADASHNPSVKINNHAGFNQLPQQQLTPGATAAAAATPKTNFNANNVQANGKPGFGLPQQGQGSHAPGGTTPSATEAKKAVPSAAPKAGPEVEHQTADHLSFLRKMIPKSTMGKVGLGLAGLSAVGAVAAVGHNKAAEREGLANFEIDDSVTSDKHSQDRAAKMYSMDDYKGGPMFISSDDGKENYRYHPKTGLHKLKSLSFEKAAEADDYLNKDTALGGLLSYSAHHLTGNHGSSIPWVGLGVAAGALGHVQKQRDELKKAQPITKAAALKNLGL